MEEEKEEEAYSPNSRKPKSKFIIFNFIERSYNLHFIFVEIPKVTMFNPKERSDKQQLFETPRNVTIALLKVVESYGYLTEDAHFHEPFEGNGLMTSVFKERGIQFTSEDLFIKPPFVDFYSTSIPPQTTVVVTNPPFRGIAKFFETMASNGNNIIIIFLIDLHNLYFIKVYLFSSSQKWMHCPLKVALRLSTPWAVWMYISSSHCLSTSTKESWSPARRPLFSSEMFPQERGNAKALRPSSAQLFPETKRSCPRACQPLLLRTRWRPSVMGDPSTPKAMFPI